MLYAIVATIFLIADQWLKYWVTVNITLATGEVSFIPGVVKLVNIHNDGAAFSALSGLSFARWLFIGLAALFVVLIIIMLARHIFPSKFVTWCGIMAITGAIGNCIDRLLYGYVVDMFKLEFINFAVFNVADVVLVISCLLFIFYILYDAIFGKDEPETEAAKIYGNPDIETASIRSDAPDFPEASAPITERRDSDAEDEFWASFKKDLHENKRSRSRAEQEFVRENPETPKPAPEIKKSPAEVNYNLEDILAEFR